MEVKRVCRGNDAPPRRTNTLLRKTALCLDCTCPAKWREAEGSCGLGEGRPKNDAKGASRTTGQAAQLAGATAYVPAGHEVAV